MEWDYRKKAQCQWQYIEKFMSAEMTDIGKKITGKNGQED